MTIYSFYHDECLDCPDSGALFKLGEVYLKYPFEFDCSESMVNAVYAGIRETFRLAGLDLKNYGTPAWNPLGAYVKPGMRVLVKLNLVMHDNPTGNGTDCLYTHFSVVAAATDYIVVGLRGNGSIILADASMQSCDFDVLVGRSGLRELVEWYRSRGVDIELKDIRDLKSVNTRAGLEQHPVLRVLVYRSTGDSYREGSWYGNDTIWRTVVDLKRLFSSSIKMASCAMNRSDAWWCCAIW